MPTLTRSQARSGRPPDLVTSSGANPPRRRAHSRQGNAVVVNNTNEVGSPSVIAANGNLSVASYTIGRCNHPLCATCSFFSNNTFFSI